MSRSTEDPWLRVRIAAIRDGTDIAAVIGAAIKLGTGRAKRGKCPFHSPNRQSFYVFASPARGYPYAHCYGCGWHGDVIRFVSDFNRISFDEALERLETEPQVTP